MNHKTAWIIALIALPLFAAVFILHAQKQDDGRDKQERSFGVEKVQAALPKELPTAPTKFLTGACLTRSEDLWITAEAGGVNRLRITN